MLEIRYIKMQATKSYFCQVVKHLTFGWFGDVRHNSLSIVILQGIVRVIGEEEGREILTMLTLKSGQDVEVPH